MILLYETKLPAEQDLFLLYEKLGWNAYLRLPAEALWLAMKQSYFAVYVYNDDALIGTGRVVSDGVTHAYACGLGVLPTYRGQGIGAAIMRKLQAYCMEHQVHMQFLCEEALVSYYQKLGFTAFAVGMR